MISPFKIASASLVRDAEGSVLLELFDHRAGDQRFDPRNERVVSEHRHRNGMDFRYAGVAGPRW